MKKTPMIALNRVKHVGRDDRGDRAARVGPRAGPSRASRRAASALDRPWGVRGCLHSLIHTAGVDRASRRYDRPNRGGRAQSARRRRGAPGQLREATKRYPGAERPAVDAPQPRGPGRARSASSSGPSGCGKTTAMRMANRMVEITEGDILVGGRSVRERSPAELRREIGYVIQQIGLFPHRTIADNIATVPRLLGWDGERTAARVDELLELIGLDPELRRPLPLAALRRPAAARRRRPGARGEPRGDADGRALRRGRPDQPRAPPERVPAPPGRDPQDDPLRHPRHRRGDQDGRPDRGPAARAASSPSTRPRPSC